MVKIIDLDEDLDSDMTATSTTEDTSDEEDGTLELELDEQKPPDLTDTSSPLASIPEERADPSASPESSRRRSSCPGVLPQSLRDGPAMYLWALLAQYARYVEIQRSLFGPGSVRQSGPDGLRMIEYKQLASSPNGNDNQELSCIITAPGEPDVSDATPDNSETPKLPAVTKSVDNEGPERAFESSDTETVSQTEEARNEGKTDSDEPTKEKNDDVGETEKVQLPDTDATSNVSLASSPDLSDYEPSDEPDSHAPPDYHTLQAESKNIYKKNTGIVYTTSVTFPWKPVRESRRTDRHPSVSSEEGETACLPTRSIAKDCWEQWVDDDRLFNVSDDINAASTSAGVRMPSPGTLTTEPRRDKVENRQRKRELERKAKPQLQRFIFAPTEKIGRILGKRGRRIREIERTSGARILIEHRRSNKPVTQITIKGTDEQILKADEEICIIIRNFKPPKANEAATASVSSREELGLKSLLLGMKNQVLDAEKRCRKS